MIRLIFIVLLCVPAAALAQASSSDATAKGHFERGKALVAASKFEDAYQAFAAAYQASPRPAFLFNMGEAARAMGDKQRARAAYERFLAAEPNGTLADTAKRRLTELGVESPPAPPVEPIRPRVPAPHGIKTAPLARQSTAPQSTPLPSLPRSESRSIWKRWPVWAAVGGGVAAAIVVVAVTSHGESDMCTPPACIDVRSP